MNSENFLEWSRLEWALYYATVLSLAVFPVAPGTKRPFYGSKGHLDATTDPNQIIAWWTNHPNANIGINCGMSGLVVLDVDIRNGKVGQMSLLQLIKKFLYDSLDTLNTWKVKTQSGGLHYYYSGSCPCSTGKLLPDLDIKGEGGYVLAPPSIVTENECQGNYEWISTEYQLQAFPDIFRPQIQAPKSHADSVFSTSFATGRRNADLTSNAGKMRRIGLEKGEIAAALQVMNLERCDDPLPEEEVEKIAESISRYQPQALQKGAPRVLGIGNGENDPPRERVGELNLIDLRTVRFERVEWFERDLIPKAELTLINGDGGIGKTTAVIDLLARASSGGTMPSGHQHDRPLRILIVAEEDRHGLLRARLDVARANHDNIRLISSVGDENEYVTFPRHARSMFDAILEGSFDVLFIDALLNHLDDDINASKPQDMRRALRPLVEVAHESSATIPAIRHISKGAGTANTRGYGSAEARNLCRSELTVGPHPDKDEYPDLLLIALSKANLSPDRHTTAAFRLRSVEIVDDDNLPTTIASVSWEKEPPIVSADELLAARNPEEQSRVDAAVDWIRSFLAAGPQRATKVCEEGKKAGHSQNTLYIAKRKATINIDKRGFPMESHWFIKEAQDYQGSHIGEGDNPGHS